MALYSTEEEFILKAALKPSKEKQGKALWAAIQFPAFFFPTESWSEFLNCYRCHKTSSKATFASLNSTAVHPLPVQTFPTL